MKKIGIFIFSGTGNTDIVAKLLKAEFEKRNFIVDYFQIEDIVKNKVIANVKDYHMIGIGSSVISYSTPKIVDKLINHLSNGENKPVFIIKTAGGVAQINYNVSKPLIKRLKKKGYDVFYERIFSIGSNWIVKFDDKVVQELYLATSKKVTIMCDELIQMKKRSLKSSLLYRVFMGLNAKISPYTVPLIGKDMYVNNSCSLCGKCIRNCPTNNIISKNGKIKFKWSCLSCMRCVYECPNKSINYRFLNFFPVKGGYNIKQTLEKTTDFQNIDVKTPSFFQSYVENDDI